ncbi:MAG: CcmD family protein [Acidobacteria bacterium]|nr:CcmD family protein [Acidobacteriota bacterium]
MDERNFTYMFYGLGAAWLILALYVVSIVAREQRLKRELEGVKRMIAEHEAQKG